MAKRACVALGYEVKRITPPAKIPDGELYDPLFSPWKGGGEFARYRELARPYTLVSDDRLYVLYILARNAVRLDGDFLECGVYRGGTARMLAAFVAAQPQPKGKLHLFDTFSGMPETDARVDLHKKGDFADTSLEEVQRVVGHPELVAFHPGWVPNTFSEIGDSRVAMAHVDVDIYRSVWDCCEFIYPRLRPGSAMVFDDYGFPSCPGARKAVDEFFAGRPESPMVLQTGQAIVIRDCYAAS